MKEYHRCKRCYSDIPVKKIAKHHLKMHPEVSHAKYVDLFFDLERPLFKCDFCSTKLPQKRMTQHLQRAHLNCKQPNQVKSVNIKSDAIDDLIEISSESESEVEAEEEEDGEIVEKLEKVDVAVQCEQTQINDDIDKKEFVDKCIGARAPEMRNVAVDASKQIKCVDIGTQVYPVQQHTSQTMKLSWERDSDGWMELVLQ